MSTKARFADISGDDMADKTDKVLADQYGSGDVKEHPMPSYLEDAWKKAGDKIKYGQEPFEGVDKAIEVYKGNTSGPRWWDVPSAFMTGMAQGIPVIGLPLDAAAMTGESGGARNALGHIAGLAPTAHKLGMMTTTLPSLAFGLPGVAWAGWRVANDPDVQRYARDWYYHGGKKPTELNPGDVAYARPRYPSLPDAGDGFGDEAPGAPYEGGGAVRNVSDLDEVEWAERNPLPHRTDGIGGHRNQGIVPFDPREMTARLRDVEWYNRYLADPNRPLSSALVRDNGAYAGFKGGGKADKPSKYPGEGRESKNVVDKRGDGPPTPPMTDKEWMAALLKYITPTRPTLNTIAQDEYLRRLYGNGDPAADVSRHYMGAIMSDEFGNPLITFPPDKLLSTDAKAD